MGEVTDFTQQGPLVYVSKLCLLLNQWGLVVAWECATANVPDKTFQGLIRQCEERMLILAIRPCMLRTAIPPTSHCVDGGHEMIAYVLRP